MAKTINFCGDSFCASPKPDSWVVKLSESLNANIVGLGSSGTAHEHAINTFDLSADYTVFCWTEAHRLYHKEYALNMASVETFRSSSDEEIYQAAHLFYKHLHDFELFEKRQIRDLYWFDHEILKHYKGVCIHLWSFKHLYTFKHGININHVLSHLKAKDQTQGGLYNHLNIETNTLLANKLNNILRNNNGQS